MKAVTAFLLTALLISACLCCGARPAVDRTPSQPSPSPSADALMDYAHVMSGMTYSKLGASCEASWLSSQSTSCLASCTNASRSTLVQDGYSARCRAAILYGFAHFCVRLCAGRNFMDPNSPSMQGGGTAVGVSSQAREVEKSAAVHRPHIRS